MKRELNFIIKWAVEVKKYDGDSTISALKKCIAKIVTLVS